MTVNRTLCSAITASKLVRFDYAGAQRIAELYAHGFNKSKAEAVRAFQVAGGSRASDPFGWKFFLVAKMRNVQTADETFPGNRPGKDDAAHDLVIIHCQRPSDTS